jgi:energy-coupling factor transport system ATP-binding protein
VTPLVELRQVEFAYPATGGPVPRRPFAIRDLSVTVEVGEIFGVIGPNASGKTTLIRLLSRVLAHAGGEILIAGRPLGALARAEVARDIAVVPQDVPQGFPYTVEELVLMGRYPHSPRRLFESDDDREHAQEALAATGVLDLRGERLDRLSGGERQRVMLARALAQRPRLLVLDEPTAHLDPSGTEAIFGILAGLRERRAATIVLIEHRAELAWPLADSVLALDDDGRPIDVGPPAAVLKRSGKRLAKAGIWLPEGKTESEARAGRTGRDDRTLGTVPVLEMRGVRFGYERENTVLRDVDLTVGPGERVALVGANGSGKSTLLRVALGLRRPTTGLVRLGERDPSRMPAVQLARLAGYVVQDPELGFLGDTVRDEVELGLEPAQVAYAHALCDHLRLPLETFGDRSPYRLSGGEQRRLSLVTALARRPLLLALDEPTFGQDRRGHEALVSALAQLVEDGSSLLAATHDERFVRDATDRRVELAAGWIVEDVGADAAADAPRDAAAVTLEAGPR